MLTRILRSMFGGVGGAAQTGDSRFPIEDVGRRIRLFERAPVDTHLGILYRDCRIGALDFLPLYRSCVERSDTHVSPWKSFIRVGSALNLAHYFLHALTIPGKRIECGVFQGFSALLLCEAARAAAAQTGGGYDGAELHLVDSFAGFPEPRQEDFIPIRERAGADETSGPAFGAGAAESSEAHVRALLSGFPQATIHRGWIPRVYATLPEARWSFVHIDVDFYEGTLTSLEYFHPRMSAGGVIVCDDYGSTLFPGAKRAWDEFFKAEGLPFIVLETGQSVFLKV